MKKNQAIFWFDTIENKKKRRIKTIDQNIQHSNQNPINLVSVAKCADRVNRLEIFYEGLGVAGYQLWDQLLCFEYATDIFDKNETESIPIEVKAGFGECAGGGGEWGGGVVGPLEAVHSQLEQEPS